MTTRDNDSSSSSPVPAQGPAVQRQVETLMKYLREWNSHYDLHGNYERNVKEALTRLYTELETLRTKLAIQQLEAK